MIIRVDDYPTGIRPIQEGQLEMFDKMIAALPLIHLGIVPRLYKNFKCCLTQEVIPCMHGVDHAYYDYSVLLSQDPYNTKTVGIFDEFEEWDDEDIPYALDWCKRYLEREFGKVESYIPVCNVLTPNLATILHEVGFTSILCENIVKSPINIIKSDFYGKLDDMPFKEYEVITFHLTWELDTIREKGFKYWLNKVKRFRDEYSI